MKKLFPFTKQYENDTLILRLLQDDDFKDLSAIALEDSIWEFFNDKVTSFSELRNWIQGAIYDFMNRGRIPFAIYSKKFRRVVGTTSIFNIVENDARVEIGYTWLGSSYQRQGINEEAKRLLLNSLFLEYYVERVSFTCDIDNLASVKALGKIGASKEGVLRSYRKRGGDRQDVAVYSILREEVGSYL